MSAALRKPNAEDWTGRDSTGQQAYLHENVRLLTVGGPAKPSAAIRPPALLGYACDIGVSRNSGRPGASAGPAALRKALGKLPWLKGAPDQLWDAGDIVAEGEALEDAQALFAGRIGELREAGYLPIGIGGGHDIAFAHYLGLRAGLPPGHTLGIVNFDAHLDLRLPEPRGHSGSPFTQAAVWCHTYGEAFRYACLGVRPDANPQELWDRAGELGALTVDRSGFRPDAVAKSLQQLRSFLESVESVYLTIDLDGFSSAYAPGVSAASPMGYSPGEMLPLLDLVLESGKVISMDVAELNPAQDRDGQTAILAASLVHRALHMPRLF